MDIRAIENNVNKILSYSGLPRNQGIFNKHVYTIKGYLIAFKQEPTLSNVLVAMLHIADSSKTPKDLSEKAKRFLESVEVVKEVYELLK